FASSSRWRSAVRHRSRRTARYWIRLRWRTTWGAWRRRASPRPRRRRRRRDSSISIATMLRYPSRLRRRRRRNRRKPPRRRGPLPRTDGPAQTAGWLLQLERTPGALGPGARIEVRLQAAATSGLLVPAEALVYAEKGSYVYRRHRTSSAAGFHYEAVPVRPLSRVGSAWLVEGLAPDDQVVVQGAGVLWSLQGVGSFSAAEEEHD